MGRPAAGPGVRAVLRPPARAAAVGVAARHAFEYSNLGYGILGRVITNSSGVEYKDLVRTRLLEPLGMTVDDLPAWTRSRPTASPTGTSGATTPGSRSRSTAMAPWPRWAACSPRSPTSPAGSPASPMPSRRATRRTTVTRSVARPAGRCSRSRRSVDPELTWASTEAPPVLLERRLRVRPVRRRRPAARPGRRPRRRLSRVRLEHDVAPGLRDRCRRGRQRPLRADVPPGHGGAGGAGPRIAGARPPCRSVARHARGAGRRGAPARRAGTTPRRPPCSR